MREDLKERINMIKIGEVPEGYKRTKHGIVPKDWEDIKLNNIRDKRQKWSITGGPFGSNLKVDDYTEKGIRIIQLQNIGDGEFIDNVHIYTSEEKANRLLSCNIYAGEIIISKMGDPVARACIIPERFTRCVMASDGIRLLVDKEKYDNTYILEFINSKSFIKLFSLLII